MTKITLDLGAMRESIAVQLKRQGIVFARPFVQSLEEDATAINRFRIRSIITKSECDKASNRLMNRISSNMKYAKITIP